MVRLCRREIQQPDRERQHGARLLRARVKPGLSTKPAASRPPYRLRSSALNRRRQRATDPLRRNPRVVGPRSASRSGHLTGAAIPIIAQSCHFAGQAGNDSSQYIAANVERCPTREEIRSIRRPSITLGQHLALSSESKPAGWSNRIDAHQVGGHMSRQHEMHQSRRGSPSSTRSRVDGATGHRSWRRRRGAPLRGDGSARCLAGEAARAAA